jgi:hypothetical protein
MNKTVTRKEFLRDGTKYAAGVALGVGGIHLLTMSGAKASLRTTPWPWPYVALDVEQVRILGHDAFWSGKGCCYGAFHALAEKLRLQIGTPWSDLPSEIMIYGHGGGAGWGTLCGAINGAAAIISMVLLKARSDLLVSELFGWYTQTLFPTDISNQYAVNHVFTVNMYDQILPQNMSGSPLCHPSVTEWCNAANYTASSTERKERCARLTGDVAAYAAKILNDELASQFVPLYVPPATIEACMTCHGSSGMNNVAAKMECTQCHGSNPHPTPVAQQDGKVPETYSLEQNYPNPFNPSTSIRFSLPKRETVSLIVYDVHGRFVKNIIASEQYGPGTYTVQWDGKNDAGLNTASGVYFIRLQAGSYSATSKMNLIK